VLCNDFKNQYWILKGDLSNIDRYLSELKTEIVCGVTASRISKKVNKIKIKNVI